MGMTGEQREPDGFELADVGRVARHSVGRWVKAARIAEQPTFSDIIAGHLDTDARGLPVAEERWPSYEHVNVQAGLDAWLATGEWEHDTLGMTGYRHRGPFGLSDLLSADEMFGPAIRPGNISTVRLAAGPDGETVECLRAAVILLSRAGDRAALLVRGSDRESDMHGVTVEIIASRDGLAAEIGARVRAAAVEHNVFRGHVVSFGQDMFGERGSALKFRRRPSMSREQLILPEETFSDVRRQVVGVARNRDRLRAAGQHLKRGLLLYGPPGVGKTHTIRYLISELADTTVVELTGETLHAIREACSVARTLQPAVIVVEDVDLIAEQRDHYSGQTPLLFTLLNEMDGLDEDADVVFVLTTNRADLLEPALTQRPGRVDQAVHIGLPGRDDRRRLIDLYRGRLEVDLSRLEDVLDRTEGVTASFLKELLRRSAVLAVEEGRVDGGEPVQVAAEMLDRALADLLDDRNEMTRAVLGFGGPGQVEADG